MGQFSKNLSGKVHNFVCSIEHQKKNVWFDCLLRKYFNGLLEIKYLKLSIRALYTIDEIMEIHACMDLYVRSNGYVCKLITKSL